MNFLDCNWAILNCHCLLTYFPFTHLKQVVVFSAAILLHVCFIIKKTLLTPPISLSIYLSVPGKRCFLVLA
jgi:hypothetical protein